MANLIHNIPISDNPNDLYPNHNQYLWDVGRCDIPIPNCKHGGEGEIQGVHVLLIWGKIGQVVTVEPVLLWITYCRVVKGQCENVSDG